MIPGTESDPVLVVSECFGLETLAFLPNKFMSAQRRGWCLDGKRPSPAHGHQVRDRRLLELCLSQVMPLSNLQGAGRSAAADVKPRECAPLCSAFAPSLDWRDSSYAPLSCGEGWTIILWDVHRKSL